MRNFVVDFRLFLAEVDHVISRVHSWRRETIIVTKDAALYRKFSLADGTRLQPEMLTNSSNVNPLVSGKRK